jgi:salicylate hydroxylase
LRPLKIAIAGSGPCGLASALLLHRDGHDITLFDRFEAAEPIGSGLMLQPTGLAVLDQLGLSSRILAEGAIIHRLFGQAANRTVLNVWYGDVSSSLFGVGVHRATLFSALQDAAATEGIEFRGGVVISGSGLDRDGRRRLRFANGSTSDAFDLVVDTMGTRSPLVGDTSRSLPFGALWANLNWSAEAGFQGDVLEQRYWRASKMVGVLPIGVPRHTGRRQLAFFWSLRGADYADWRSEPLERWKEEVAALWPATVPLLDQLHGHDQLTYARYAHRTLGTPVEPGLIHLGDAWHSASPQLGQGANMALLDAYALAVALRSATDMGDALSRTIRIRRRHVFLYQAITAMFTPVYQSDSHAIAAIRDWMIGPLSQIAPIARLQVQLVTGLFGSPLRALDLTTTA